MTVLELLYLCKRHGVIVELKYIDFADAYKLTFVKDGQRVVKLTSDEEMKRLMVDPLWTTNNILKDIFTELGVTVDG